MYYGRHRRRRRLLSMYLGLYKRKLKFFNLLLRLACDDFGGGRIWPDFNKYVKFWPEVAFVIPFVCRCCY